MDFQNFSKKEAHAEQVIEANQPIIEITDSNGDILSQFLLVKLLKDSDIEYKPNKMTIVHGKNAFFVGLILTYLGERTVSVVLEDTTGFVSTKKNRKTAEAKKFENTPNKTLTSS